VGGADAVSRFQGISRHYDAVRPRPPHAIVDLINDWTGITAPDVVDLGAGSGLSTVLWSGHAARITAVEPGDGMRAIAAERVAALPDAASVTLVAASAEATGLPDASADVVTVSQAMHWFDPERAIPEIARILRPGGVFVAYDAQWPPSIHWEVDAAYLRFEQRYRALEIQHGVQPRRADKEGHAARLAASGLFRHVNDIALHSREEGDAERLRGIMTSQGGAAALLDRGVTEEELGLDAVAEAAARHLREPRPWWWTYRVRVAVR
jgi:ubiquinone/menaquinone biosynthesis C-methylase UbiE